MHPLGEYATSVARLEADYAGTVLWFIYDVPYEVTHLSAGLIRDLEAWEEFSTAPSPRISNGGRKTGTATSLRRAAAWHIGFAAQSGSSRK